MEHTFGVGTRAHEVFLIDAVPETVRNPSHDRTTNLAGGHLPEFGGGGVAVEGSVWGAEQVGRILERSLEHVVRFVFVYVERRRPDASLLEGGRERVVVDETAARRVDEEGARSHLLDGELIDEVVVVFVERAVQGYAVGLEEKVLERVDARQSEALLDAVWQVRVVEDDVETERLSPQRDRRTDPAEADNTESVTTYPGAALGRLAHLLRPRKLFPLPDHVREPVGSPVQVEDEAERRVGHFLDAVSGNVANCYTELAGRFNVDIIHPRTYTNYDS